MTNKMNGAKHVKVTNETLQYLYYNANGNLYYRPHNTKEPYQVVEDFEYEEVRYMFLMSKWDLIWIEGLPLAAVEV